MMIHSRCCTLQFKNQSLFQTRPSSTLSCAKTQRPFCWGIFIQQVSTAAPLCVYTCVWACIRCICMCRESATCQRANPPQKMAYTLIVHQILMSPKCNCITGKTCMEITHRTLTAERRKPLMCIHYQVSALNVARYVCFTTTDFAN